VARVGAGALAALGGGLAVARSDDQFGGVNPVSPLPDPRFAKPPTWETQFKEVAPNVYAYIQAGGPGRDNASVANAGIIVGDKGVAVIDTLTAPIHAKAFIAAVRRVTDKPFMHVFLTHHHGDHINGTQHFDGAEILSHPYCRDEVVKVARARPSARRDGWADGQELQDRANHDVRRQDDVSVRKHVLELYDGAGLTRMATSPGCRSTRSCLWATSASSRRAVVSERASEQVDRGSTRSTGWVRRSSRSWSAGRQGGTRDMRDYLVRLKSEARTRYDAKMTAGAAAAGIRMGKYDNWIGPERIVLNVQRFYDEFAGTLTPDINVSGIQRATGEYNAARNTAAR
jgi:hypothetical protein